MSSNDLVLYLKMDEIEIQEDGTVIVPDSSGEQQDGVMINDNVTLIPDDQFGSCLNFNGQQSYFPIKNLFYDNNNNIGAITVQAWVKTTINDSELIIASWDRSEYWRFAVGNDQSQPQGRVFWATAVGDEVDDMIGQIEVADGVWHYLTVTYDKATGHKSIYVDGQLDSTLENPHNNSPIGTNSSRYGFVGAGSEADSFNEEIGPDHYFNGQMAHLRIYHRALSLAEIQQNMDADRLAITQFQSEHPLAFELYDANQQPVLYIDDNPYDNNLTMELHNTANQALQFANLGNSVSPQNYHFELRFPPGTLADTMLDTDKLLLQETATWSLHKEKRTDNSFSVYFLCHDQATFFGNPDGLFSANDHKMLTLQRITAATAGGARGSRVELRPTNLTFHNETTPIIGNRVQHLQILSHQGKKDIPLHVGFVGDNTILNDGVTNNNLTLRISNLSKNETLRLSEQSQFILSLKAGPTTEEWTLGTSSQINNISINLITNASPAVSYDNTTLNTNDKTVELVDSSSNASSQESFELVEIITSGGDGVSLEIDQPDGGTASSIEWLIDQTMLSITELAAGQYIDIELSNIITSHPSGQSKLTFYYTNIPGYWDGHLTCFIQKSPLLYRGNNVAIGTTSALDTLSIGDGIHLHSWPNTGDPSIGFGFAPGGNGEATRTGSHVKLEWNDESDNGEIFRIKSTSQRIEKGENANVDAFLSDRIVFTENEQVVINPTVGDVGIGTTDPKGKLHVNGGDFWVTASGDNGLRIRTDVESGNGYGFDTLSDGIAFINEESTWNQAIVMGDAGTTSSDVLFGVSVTESGTDTATTGQEDWQPRFAVLGNGDLRICGEEPIIMKRYTSLGDNIDYDTGMSSNIYAAAMIGFRAQGGDINEGSHSGDLMKIYLHIANNRWYIRADFRTHHHNENWYIDVMFIRRELVRLEGY